MRIHFVAVKVGIVRRRDTQVEPKGHAIRQHAHPVAHHGHFVQRRLPVKQDDIPVDHVAIHDVAAFQFQFFGRVREAVAPPARRLDHTLGPRIRVAIRDIHGQFRQVQLGHRDRVGQIGRNAQRHAQLVQRNVGVGRNDGARRKVAALAHQVVAHAALLGAEALLERLERPPTAPLARRQHPRHIIVHESGHVVLQEPVTLFDFFQLFFTGLAVRRQQRKLRLLRGYFLAQRIVGLDNVRQLVGQVVFGLLVAVLPHARPHMRRRHRQHRANHPIRPRILWRQANQFHLFVRDALENQQDIFDGHFGLFVVKNIGEPAVGFALFVLLQTVLGLGRIAKVAQIRRGLGASLLVALTLAQHGGEPRLELGLALHNLFLVLFFQQTLGAAPAHTLEHLQDNLEHLHVIHRFRQGNVPKMARAVVVVLFARLAHLPVFNDPHARVKQTVGLGQVVFIRVGLGHLQHRPRDNVLGAPNRQDNTGDTFRRGGRMVCGKISTAGLLTLFMRKRHD